MFGALVDVDVLERPTAMTSSADRALIDPMLRDSDDDAADVDLVS